MTGTEESFKKWVKSHGVDVYFYRNTIRERSGVYSVTVPEIGLNWSGDAQDANEARILAVENYELRSKNPVKKKRSAKQLANDKRLGRMAKARANRGALGSKKHGGRRKVAKRKPRRKNTLRARQTAIQRATNPKRKKSAKSHLWLLFRCVGNKIQFYNGGWPISGQWGSRDKAALYRTRGHASANAKALQRKGPKSTAYGAAQENTTTAKIKEYCNYELGKA